MTVRRLVIALQVKILNSSKGATLFRHRESNRNKYGLRFRFLYLLL